MILPRLEVFFLEEWIQHHLNLGVDEIYLYNSGNKPFRECGGFRNRPKDLRSLNSEEQNIKWGKKPDADYFLEFSDSEINDKLNEIVMTYKNNVFLKSWVSRIDHNETKNVNSQITGYRDAVSRSYDGWWMLLDPDEFLYSPSFDSIRDFLVDSENNKNYNIRLSQRVFNCRKPDYEVRRIFDYCGDLSLSKSFIKNPILNELKVHTGKTMLSDEQRINKNQFRFNHYRGPSEQMGGPAYGKLMYKPFDKIDEGMLKYM